MIITGTLYNIKCDCCGRVINDEWLPDVKAAELELEETGVKLGGRHYCFDCYDYNDNMDIVTKDGRKFDGRTEKEIV